MYFFGVLSAYPLDEGKGRRGLMHSFVVIISIFHAVYKTLIKDD